eukprot:TRINITY_DN69155_c0_g1_i1.p1 TRINITY_DN69155_c0_g1~~TRINITY_DN69155_c0_g1_i1.p1  ORF type:complete len:367 (+),score=4.00 TRINITY_DN69155_c0_g1_i1:34-1134(+)
MMNNTTRPQGGKKSGIFFLGSVLILCGGLLLLHTLTNTTDTHQHHATEKEEAPKEHETHNVGLQNTLVGFIGDTTLGTTTKAVLQLLADEQVHVVSHQGDLDYEDKASSIGSLINSHVRAHKIKTETGDELKRTFLLAIGNAETPPQATSHKKYTKLLSQHVYPPTQCTKMSNYGTASVCTHGRVLFIHLAPAMTSSATDNAANRRLISSAAKQYPLSSHPWRVCALHMSIASKRLHNKGSAVQTVFDSCLGIGALIVSAHDHIYARSAVVNSYSAPAQKRIVGDATSSGFRLCPGMSLNVVSGLGGKSVGSGKAFWGSGWWHKVYAEQGKYGALLCDFGEDVMHCKFKLTDGETVDQFQLLRCDS